jgi:hypothetical protein
VLLIEREPVSPVGANCAEDSIRKPICQAARKQKIRGRSARDSSCCQKDLLTRSTADEDEVVFFIAVCAATKVEEGSHYCSVLLEYGHCDGEFSMIEHSPTIVCRLVTLLKTLRELVYHRPASAVPKEQSRNLRSL